MLEDAIAHSVHAVHQPSRAAHTASHHTPPPLGPFDRHCIAHSSDLIEISAHAKNDVRRDTTAEREPPQTGRAAYQASYNAGTAQTGSSQGQGYTHSLPMHHRGPPTTSNTSPLRRLIPPSYSHPSHKQHSSRSTCRTLSMSSDATSADSSENEGGGLPREGLVAPFSVLHELADWADAGGERSEVSFSFGILRFPSVPGIRSPCSPKGE